MILMRLIMKINLIDLLEECNFETDALQYVVLVKMLDCGFPICFDYRNPKNPKPKLIRGSIKTISTDNITLEYIYND